MADLKRVRFDNFSATVPQLAPYFNSAASYVVGDVVSYEGAVYEFTSAHSGAWNASHVTQVTMATLKQDINQGHGLPSGGVAGDFLVKNSSTNYDASWVTMSVWNGGSY